MLSYSLLLSFLLSTYEIKQGEIEEIVSVKNSNQRGAYGIWELSGALALPLQLLRMSLNTSFLYDRNVYSRNDSLLVQHQDLAVRWAPLPYADVGLKLGLLVSTYQDALQRTLVGWSGLHLSGRYHVAQWDHTALAVDLLWRIPSSTQSAWPAIQSSVVSPHALLESNIYNWVRWMHQVGFVLDFSNSLLQRNTSREDRFVLDSYNSHRFVLGSGIVSKWFSLGIVGFAPFIECYSFLALPGSGWTPGLKLTPGTKISLLTSPSLEASLGVELGLVGRTGTSTAIAGYPLWKVFFQASFQTMLSEKSVHVGCRIDGDCPENHACYLHSCQLRQQPIVAAVEPEKVPLLRQVVELRDKQTQEVIPHGKVVLQEFPGTVLLVEEGKFVLWPIEQQAKIPLTILIPDYKTTPVVVPIYGAEEIHTVYMDPEPGNLFGTIKGSVFNRKTGKPLPGVDILIIPGNQHIETDEKGCFSLQVKPDAYQVIVSRKGYETEILSFELAMQEQFSASINLKPTVQRIGK